MRAPLIRAHYFVAKDVGNKRAREAVISLSKLVGIITVDRSDCEKAMVSRLADFEDALLARMRREK